MENGPEVTVNVQLKPNDVFTPVDWNYRNIARWVLASVIAYAVYDVCFSPGNTLATLPDAKSISAVLVVLAGFIVLGLLLFPYLRLVAIMRKSAGFREPAKFIFSPKGLRFESTNATGEYSWSAFARVTETKKSFAISQNDFAGTYIPKRCFGSPGDVASLRQLVRDNFKGKWTLRRD
jgi:hypothetical protein